MADMPDLISQDEIERLLSSSMAGAAGSTLSASPAGATQPVGPDRPAATTSGSSPLQREPPSQPGEESRTATNTTTAGIAQSDMEVLLQQAEKALASIEEGPAQETPPGMAPFHWEELSVVPANAESATLDLIRDVELDVSIELGRTRMYLEDVLKLRRGAVVTLDKLAGDPVDVYVNGRLVARGEVLVLNDNFCVRVAELVAGVSSS